MLQILKNCLLKERQKRSVTRAYERTLYPTSDIRRMLEGLAPLNAKNKDEEGEEGDEGEEVANPAP